MEGAREEPVAVSRVNGADLQAYFKQFVSVLGYASDMQNDRRSFKLTTLDNVVLTVRMTTLIDTLIEGLVEVEGKVLGKNMLDCHHWTGIETSEPIDSDVFSEVIGTCAKRADLYITTAQRIG